MLVELYVAELDEKMLPYTGVFQIELWSFLISFSWYLPQ